MCGGRVVQVVRKSDATYVEVVDTNFSRAWCQVASDTDIQEQDEIWWMNFIGYLSRGEEFQDRNIGRCMGANPHGRPSRV